MADVHRRAEPTTLAGGAVVQAHVVARLLGVKLLKVDATIVLAPATDLAPVPVHASPQQQVPALPDLPPPTDVVPPRPVGARALRGRDGGLREAASLLDQARASLNGTR
ncbi:hypothetical protein [Mumia zhuanghuii]|uniref:Uncharacterized protein n=1 Tax=Mumia zhuanghuii TaxID=2585211 RepID=A0A5C4MEX0_9ACTN|nr:hypothetical protein [Mumia zhuanghuii]TNC42293.1 hypothetical protein FHE65_21595 [Mumia zhuanghuii]TNC46333.1 hypothetical protein FHE65_12950 [Mumia zhuanghuii]